MHSFHVVWKSKRYFAVKITLLTLLLSTYANVVERFGKTNT